MRISMWILAKWLSKYEPHLFIEVGAATIGGVRFMKGDQMDFPRDYVYVGHAAEAFSDPNYYRTIVLANGHDLILIAGANADTEIIVNEILAAIEYYNKWEAKLWEASALEDALQKMIELSDDVFDHPSRIIDMDGRVLAISKKYGPNDVDERWKKTYESGVVDLTNVGTPVITMEGEYLHEWEEIPRRYYTEERGVNYIAANIQSDNEIIAAFFIQEHRTKFTLSHCQLAAVFCEILKTVFSNTKNSALRSKSSILMDLLEGGSVIDKLPERLTGDGTASPMLLISVRSIRDNTPRIRKGSMLIMIRELKTVNISVIYQEDVVCVVLRSHLDAFIRGLMRIVNPQYYMIGISLPFEGWDDIPVRYKQACFAIGLSGRVSGIYDCKNFAFEYLISAISNQNNSLQLQHPALVTLEMYDREHNTGFYETLYHYIANERSHAETSKAMGIHRNTLMYRIKRICEIIESNLEDPDERAFISLSYKISKKRNSRPPIQR